MIIFLLLSIISSTFLLIILKSFQKWNIDTLHGIVFNYWTASLLSFMVAPGNITNHLHELHHLWYVAAAIGFMFITVFFIIGKTTQKLGVGVTSVASKMSMIIPISAGFILYNETFNIQKLTGILLAIPAVILVSRPSEKRESAELKLSGLFLPVILFFGAGLVDTAIKYAQATYINDNNRQLVIMSIFVCAGTIGLMRLLYELIFLRKKLKIRSIGGGILLGIANYLSLFFLLKCLEDPNSESSSVFAFANIGVVVFSFLSGLFLFREKAERNKVIGVVLSLIAITVLSY